MLLGFSYSFVLLAKVVICSRAVRNLRIADHPRKFLILLLNPQFFVFFWFLCSLYSLFTRFFFCRFNPITSSTVSPSQNGCLSVFVVSALFNSYISFMECHTPKRTSFSLTTELSPLRNKSSQREFRKTVQLQLPSNSEDTDL